MKKIYIVTYRISVTSSVVTDWVRIYFSSFKRAQSFIDYRFATVEDKSGYIDIHIEVENLH